jgi:hypothetical protein
LQEGPSSGDGPSLAVERRNTMTTTLTRRTELAHRTSDGIEVYLFWNEPTNLVTVSVLDARTDEGFELEVDGHHALDAFNHPYVYNEWRTDHARTDR